MNKSKSLLCALLLSVVCGSAGYAQLDPTIRILIFQNGRVHGEVFVPERAPEELAYLEHWVIYPDFQYPGPGFIGALMLTPVPSMRPYADTQEFFRTAPFPAGSKYIQVESVESDTLPGR